MKYFEVDGEPIETLFGGEEGQWQQTASGRAYRARTREAITLARTVWRASEPFSTLEMRTPIVTENDSEEIVRVAVNTTTEECLTRYPITIRVTDMIMDNRYLSTHRPRPHRYGSAVRRDLTVSAGEQKGPSIPPTNGVWVWQDTVIGDDFRNFPTYFRVSSPKARVDEPTYYATSASRAERVNTLVQTLLQLPSYEDPSIPAKWNPVQIY